MPPITSGVVDAGATGATGPIGANVWFENINLLNLEDYNDNTGTRFAPTAGFIYSQGFIAPITGAYNKIKLKIKIGASPRHVPAKIISVKDIISVKEKN